MGLKGLGRFVFNQWAKSGKMPGYLYGMIDQYGGKLADGELEKTLYNGVSMTLNLEDHLSRMIYFFGAYEPVESYLLLNLAKEDSVFFDIGGNIGFYSLLLGKKLENKGAVHTFEPVESNFKKLQRDVQKNNLAKTIHLNNFGLWHKEETLSFSLAEDQEGNLGSFTAGAQDDVVERVEAKVRRLDDYVKEQNIQKIDLVKMDIEGAELFALQGGQESFARFRPIVQVEVYEGACEKFDYTTADLWKFFKDLNYKILRPGLFPHECQVIESFEGLPQGNVLLFPEEVSEYVLRGDWAYPEIKKFYLGKSGA